MLCIALLALAVVGHVDTASARNSDQLSYAASSPIGDQGGDSKSVPDTSDHCCCAHPVSADTADNSVTVSAFGDSLVRPLSDGGAPTGVRDGPERPPKTTAG